MMKNHFVPSALFFFGVLLSCCAGGQVRKTVQPRDFPMVRVPATLTGIDARAAWISAHYWDPFLDPETALPSADTLFNGIGPAELEQQVGNFCYILQLVPVETAREALSQLYGRLDALAAQFPDDALPAEMTRLFEKYLYDPNSPMRCEDAFNLVATRLAADARQDEATREKYARIARLSARNATGTPAADFSFVDAKGQQRSLYGIAAEQLLLIFGNPDCHACVELMDALSDNPVIAARIRSGALKVVDIYIDEDLATWRANVDAYPADWINGCDPDGAIRAGELYHVRAIPSLYLLDADKTVLLKDAPQERVLAYLANL